MTGLCNLQTTQLYVNPGPEVQPGSNAFDFAKVCADKIRCVKLCQVVAQNWKGALVVLRNRNAFSVSL